MKSFVKYSGILVQLIGVLCLIVPYFGKFQNNTTLLIGWLLIISGLVLYIVINKRIS